MYKIKLPSSVWGVLILILSLGKFVQVIITNFTYVENNQYSYLARAFLAGSLSFLEIPGGLQDIVFFDGKLFWHLAPFPALLLMPFVGLWDAFADSLFLQGYLQVFLTFGIFLLCLFLAMKFGYKLYDSIYLAFAFIFSSVYVVVAYIPWSWNFVQAIAVLLQFLAIYEYKSKKRYWLIGLFYGFIFMSRFTAGFTVLFFVFSIFLSKYSFDKKFKDIVMLILPVVLSGLLLLSYNYARFQNPFDNGYYTSNEVTMNDDARFEQINYGLFQLRNIPTNFYYYFLKSIDPILLEKETLFGNTFILKYPYFKVNYPGTSFFVVSPIFLYLLKVNYKKKENLKSLLSVLFVLAFLLTYYWPGWVQLGPRYTLDFLPFAYLLLLDAFDKKRLPALSKVLILVSAEFNTFLLNNLRDNFPKF